MADAITLVGDNSSSGVVIDGQVTTAGVSITGEIQTGGKGDPGLSIKGDKGDPGIGIPAGGTPGQIPVRLTGPDYTLGWADGGSGSAAKNVTKTAHGFYKGQIIAIGPSGFKLALADSAANAEVIGIVGQVIDANTFQLVAAGPVSGISGLTVGTVYFVSPTTAGNMTATEPTGATQVSKPVFIADSSNSGWFFNFRGFSGAAAGGGGGGGSAAYSVRGATGNDSMTSADDTVIAVTAGITVTWPDATGCTVKPYRLINSTNGNIISRTVTGQLFEGSTDNISMAPGQSILAVPYNGAWLT